MDASRARRLAAAGLGRAAPKAAAWRVARCPRWAAARLLQKEALVRDVRLVQAAAHCVEQLQLRHEAVVGGGGGAGTAQRAQRSLGVQPPRPARRARRGGHKVGRRHGGAARHTLRTVHKHAAAAAGLQGRRDKGHGRGQRAEQVCLGRVLYLHGVSLAGYQLRVLLCQRGAAIQHRLKAAQELRRARVG